MKPVVSSTPAPSSISDRVRVTLDLSPSVASLLDHISEVTGAPKSQVVLGPFLEALPDLLARADSMARRHKELKGAKR